LVEQYGDSLAAIRYHFYYPSSGDPFYQYNIPENDARANFYYVSGVPQLWVDGTTDGGWQHATWESLIRDRWNYDAYLEIELFGNYDSPSREVDLIVRVTAPGYVPTSWDLRIVVVLTESSLSYGGRTHNQVMRDMIPSSSGDTLTIHEGQTKERKYNFPIDHQLVDSNCELVVFVQNFGSYELVLQAAKSGLYELTPLGVEDNLEAAVPTQSELLQNYPNPFNASTKISYQLTEAARTRLEIFNLRGELVRSLVNDVQSPGSYQVNWDGTDSEGGEVSSGLYFYRLTSGEVSQTQKMSLLR
jgi:hypothetical protein